MRGLYENEDTSELILTIARAFLPSDRVLRFCRNIFSK